MSKIQLGKLPVQYPVVNMTTDNEAINYFNNKHSAVSKLTENYTMRRDNIGQYINSPYDTVGFETEKVVAIHLPESEFYKLCYQIKKSDDEMNITRRDERLYKLYMEYRLWLDMIK